MGVNCYCNNNTEQGNIPVPPLDKTVDISNVKENNEKFNRQETYNRIFTINKNDLKTVPSNKNENDNINNSIKNEININSNDNNNNNNNNSNNNNLEFDKILSKFTTQISEENFNSEINIKIKEIESKFEKINQNKKDEIIKNKDINNIIFKSPLLFKESNIKYFGSWNPRSFKKEGWGILIDKDGNKFEGGWDNDIIDIYGRITSINGDFYEGEIKKGIIEGEGIFYSDEKKMTYKGEFKNNIFDGTGQQIFENSDKKKLIYEGMFKNGKREGKGKFIFEDGNIYEGDFSNDKFNGEGCFKWTDGREYKGKWVDNQMNGKGVFIWDKNNWYEGEYKDNRREGFGTYYFGENYYFEGKWINNLPHGEGKINKDGTIIEGLFRFGKIIKNKNNKKGKTTVGKIKNMKFKDENANGNIFNKKRNSFQ